MLPAHMSMSPVRPALIRTSWVRKPNATSACEIDRAKYSQPELRSHVRLMRTLLVTVSVLSGLLAAGVAAEFDRSIPRVSAAHPGNIFLAGENIVVSAPPGEVETW